jgi:hypothetical protein
MYLLTVSWLVAKQRYSILNRFSSIGRAVQAGPQGGTSCEVRVRVR